MKKEQALGRKIEKIKRALMELGDMRPGSLTVQTRKWGGEYGQLSYTHRGKGHTEYVPGANRKHVKQQIANYKKFTTLTQDLIQLCQELCKLKTKREVEK